MAPEEHKNLDTMFSSQEWNRKTRGTWKPGIVPPVHHLKGEEWQPHIRQSAPVATHVAHRHQCVTVVSMNNGFDVKLFV